MTDLAHAQGTRTYPRCRPSPAECGRWPVTAMSACIWPTPRRAHPHQGDQRFSHVVSGNRVPAPFHTSRPRRPAALMFSRARPARRPGLTATM